MQTKTHTPKITTKQVHFRVVVELDERGPYGLRYEPTKSDADDVLRQIVRHVESSIPCSLGIEWDTVCAHCGLDPEVDKVEGPVCCQSAQDEWETSKAEGRA